MTTTAVPTTARESCLAAYAALEALAADPAWLAERRQAAIARFTEVGFPSPREEDWRYTNVARITARPWRVPGGDTPEPVGREAIEPFLLGPASWTRLLFVNGRYAPGLSSLGRLPAGAHAGSLVEALGTDGELVRAHLARQASDGDGFTALSTALFQDGAFVYLPAGVTAAEPIHLLSISTVSEPEAELFVAPRYLVVAAPGSRATIVESHVGLAGGGYLANTVTEVVLEDGARLDHVKLQEDGPDAFHVSALHVRHGRDSAFASSTFTLGGRLVRNTLRVLMAGEGATCTLNGLYAIGDQQHVDNHVTVDHARPRGTSRQLYKGILDGKSRAVFNGRIIVQRGAQKTDAHQTNKNLLLSEGAEVDSKPWLEIFADDVRCTHGAADGQLAEDALFYLKSRGLSEAGARTLLTYGFANEVLERVPVAPVRAHLEHLVLKRLQTGRVGQETS